jgi:ankyrin repeat protein
VPPGPRELTATWTVPTASSATGNGNGTAGNRRDRASNLPIPIARITMENAFAELMTACRVGNTTRVVEIATAPSIDMTTLINRRDNLRRTLLFYAVDSARIDCVETLINFYQADVRLTDASGNTALHHAVELANEDMTRILVNAVSRHGGDAHNATNRRNVQQYVNICNVQGVSSLQIAVTHASIPIIRLLVAHGASTDVKDTATGSTMLHLAAKIGHYELCRYLIFECHANVQILNNDWKTPLHLAAEVGEVSVARLLYEQISHKPEQYLRRRDRNSKIAFHYALIHGKREMSQYLISIDPEESIYITTGMSTGKTTLMYAAEGGNVNIVEDLLKAVIKYPRYLPAKGVIGFFGAKSTEAMTQKQFMDMKLGGEGTALQRALTNQRYDVAASLIKQGAELHILPSQLIRNICETAEDAAYCVLRELLLLDGKRFNEQDLTYSSGKHIGKTVLHVTCFKPALFQMLLEHTSLPIYKEEKADQSVLSMVLTMLVKDPPPPENNQNGFNLFAWLLGWRQNRRAEIPREVYYDRTLCLQSLQHILQHRVVCLMNCSIPLKGYTSLYEFACVKSEWDLLRSILRNDIHASPFDLFSSSKYYDLVRMIVKKDNLPAFLVLVNDFQRDITQMIEYTPTGASSTTTTTTTNNNNNKKNALVATALSAESALDRSYNMHHETYLHIACAYHAVSIVEYLVHQPNINVNAINPDDQARPIHRILSLYRARSLEILKILLKCPSLQVCVLNRDHMTPLHLACKDGDDKLVAHYLKHRRKNFVPFWALEVSATEKAQYYYNRDLEIRSSENQTPLQYAKRGGHTNIVKLLEEDKQWTVFIMTAYYTLFFVGLLILLSPIMPTSVVKSYQRAGKSIFNFVFALFGALLKILKVIFFTLIIVGYWVGLIGCCVLVSIAAYQYMHRQQHIPPDTAVALSIVIFAIIFYHVIS